jgi:hypothetical protein
LRDCWKSPIFSREFTYEAGIWAILTTSLLSYEIPTFEQAGTVNPWSSWRFWRYLTIKYWFLKKNGDISWGQDIDRISAPSRGRKIQGKAVVIYPDHKKYRVAESFKRKGFNKPKAGKIRFVDGP